MKTLLALITFIGTIGFAKADLNIPVDVISQIQADKCAYFTMKFDKEMDQFNVNKAKLPGKEFNFTNCTKTLKIALNDLSGQCLISEEQTVNLKDLNAKVNANCSEFYPVIKGDLGSFYANDYCKSAYNKASQTILELLLADSNKRAKAYQEIRYKILTLKAKQRKQNSRL